MIKLFKPLSIAIGLRYTAAKRKNNFISFISFMSIGGIALGLMAIIVVLSVMNGFQQGIRDIGQSMAYDLKMVRTANNSYFADWQTSFNLIKHNPNVITAAPFTNSEGLMNANGLMRPVQLEGVDPQYQNRVSNVIHNYELLEENPTGIVLGSELAKLLDVTIGDAVTIIIPELTESSSMVIPRTRSFTVIDTFNVGMYEYDAHLAIVHISAVNQMLKLPSDAVQGIRIKLRDINLAPLTGNELVNDLADDSILIYSWVDQFKSLFEMIETEKRTIFMIMSLIIAVAMFNVISTLVMVVTDKRAEIAILRTLGLSPFNVMVVFLVQGVVIGFWGVFLGTTLGLLISSNVNTLIVWIESLLGFTVFEPSVYPLSHIPTVINWGDITLISTIAFILAATATLYPAWKAAKTQPAEALRYE